MTNNTAPIFETDDIVRRLNLGGLVKDWGGFEKLVAELNATGDVTVEHNVKLAGKSGAPRQIDVLIRHKQGLIEHLVVIDCKRWKDKVSRADVDALANTVREVNASRGVLFSVMGFESGAITQAKADGIELFTVRELTDEEWGLPGRHVDFFIQIESLSVANFQIPDVMVHNITTSLNFDFRFGVAGAESITPILKSEGTNAKTVEELIISVANQGARELYKPAVLFDGKDGSRRFWKTLKIDLKHPVVVPAGGGMVLLPSMTFDLGLAIEQVRFQFDRGAKYAFALAVQDEVRGVVNAASRELGDGTTTLLTLPNGERKSEPVLTKGSIMTIRFKGFYDFDFVNLAKGEFHDALKPAKPLRE